jgi:hypothetical protein
LIFGFFGTGNCMVAACCGVMLFICTMPSTTYFQRLCM